MKYVAVCVLAFRLISFDFYQIESATFDTSEEVARAECVEKIRQVDDSNFNTNVIFPPTLNGKWVSKRCETRPGPQFVLRSYTFYPDNVFRLIQFRYNDESCSSIGFTIKIAGSYRIKNGTSSTTISPADETELSYDVKQITIIVHDMYWAKNLSRAIKDRCKNASDANAYPPYWKPFVEYPILAKKSDQRIRADSDIETTNSYTKHSADEETRDFDNNFCGLSALGIKFDELRTLRVHAKTSVDGRIEHELLLAANTNDRQSDDSSKPSIISNKFQLPLVLVNESTNCLICETVAQSTNMFVQHLPAKATLPLNLRINGEWISERCEIGSAATANLYAIRMLSVDQRNGDWNLETKFYDDYKCVNLSVVHRTFGKFLIGRSSKKIPGATEIAFAVKKAYVMATSAAFLSRLRNNDDGNYDDDIVRDWKLNEVQEIPVNGYNSTVIPNTMMAAFDIARLETDEDGSLILLLGEKSSSIRRFTSYQYPLLQCSSRTFYSYLDTSAYSQYIAADKGANRRLSFSFYVVTSISSIIFSYSFVQRIFF